MDARQAEEDARQAYANACTQQEAEAAEAAIKAAVVALAAAQAEVEPPPPVEEVFDEDQLPMFFQVPAGRVLRQLLPGLSAAVCWLQQAARCMRGAWHCAAAHGHVQVQECHRDAVRLPPMTS